MEAEFLSTNGRQFYSKLVKCLLKKREKNSAIEVGGVVTKIFIMKLLNTINQMDNNLILKYNQCTMIVAFKILVILNTDKELAF